MYWYCIGVIGKRLYQITCILSNHILWNVSRVVLEFWLSYVIIVFMEILKEDRRKITAPINGLLGGRPRGNAIELARLFKQKLNEMIDNEKVPLIKSMLRQAKKGNVMAFNALLDRAQGKPAQAVEMSGKDGAPIVFMPLELIQKHALQVANEVVEGEVLDDNVKTLQSFPASTPKKLDNGSVKPL